MSKIVNGPIGRDIRTGEGVLVWLTNIAIAVAAGIDPSHLSPHLAAILVSAVTVLHLVASKTQKVLNAQTVAGLGSATPISAQAIERALGLNTSISDADITSAVDTAVNAATNLVAPTPTPASTTKGTPA